MPSEPSGHIQPLVGVKQMYPLLFGVFGLKALDCLGFQGFTV